MTSIFTAKLQDGQVLKKVVDAIKDLVTDVNLEVSDAGISLQAMDSSHVALVSLKLKQDGFAIYRTERQITLGLSITNLSKIMKLVNNNDSITLSCQGPEPTHLKIICESPNQDRRTEFSLNLISLDSENLGIPETSYQSEITMHSAEFSKLCRELYSLSETVTFEITQSYVKFAIDGEVGTGNILIKTGGEDTAINGPLTDANRDAVSLSFALRYLNLFNKAYTLSQQVKISMSADTPLVVEYEVENMGELKFYLAPKISEDAN